MTVVFPAVLHAIVVTFTPEWGVLQLECAMLATQVDKTGCLTQHS